MEDAQKKSVSQIMIERFLKEVDKYGQMPWQRPYEVYNAFNYFSEQTYRGINRLMLGFGEYLTANQINEYNKSHEEDFRFQKGIEWYPVVFYKNDIKECSIEEVQDNLKEGTDISKEGYLGYNGRWAYIHNTDGTYVKQRSILRYSLVAERRWFRNSKGELLPSKLETGEVQITLSKPGEVLNSYINREGINLVTDYSGVPHYNPSSDTVCLNNHYKKEEEYFSTAFHECGHSTGAEHRLNRIGITSTERNSKNYAVEECIAEICAYLCCAECGIHDFITSGTMSYENNLAYVNSWKKRITEFDKEFIYIVSQADKAFNFIMGMDI